MTMPARPWYRRNGILLAALGLAAGAALLVALAWKLGRSPRGGPFGGATAGAGGATQARLSIAAALQGADTAGFARALTPRPFRFPADLGPHDDFRTEWWYFTGNLATAHGRRFGFQLTFFRVALAPPAAAGTGPAAAARTSAWATRQLYFAHFTVTDVAGRQFHAGERWERGALGLAGAQADPLRVWVGPWSATAAPSPAGPPGQPAAAATGEGSTARAAALPIGSFRQTAAMAAGTVKGAAGPPIGPIRLAAATPAGDGDGASGAYALDLTLDTALPPLAQGDRGLSAKSAEPGNASYYYSLPRLDARGELRLGGERFAVSGLAWMDREWSTSALAAGEVGWDWFGLQLDDGWELMLYRLRRASPPGGAIDPVSQATLIAPDGTATVTPLAAWSYGETAAWTSPTSGVRYPAGWHLRRTVSGVPGGGGAGAGGRAGAGGAGGSADLDINVRPLLAGQELPLALRYWEGAVEVGGTHAGHPIGGHGYVELTGYTPAGRPGG